MNETKIGNNLFETDEIIEHLLKEYDGINLFVANEGVKMFHDGYCKYVDCKDCPIVKKGACYPLELAKFINDMINHRIAVLGGETKGVVKEE